MPWKGDRVLELAKSVLKELKQRPVSGGRQAGLALPWAGVTTSLPSKTFLQADSLGSYSDEKGGARYFLLGYQTQL